MNPANLQTKDESMTYTVPVPTDLLPYLEKKGVVFTKSSQRTMMSNITVVEIHVRSGLDITAIIYAAFEHDIDARLSAINERFTFKMSVA